ncbi:hypothetical protein KVR01_002950 [Diaporthe batatas]|uniref:uncharacterized protein n=1 Tax=Diaporthe batatas TaxID=748121 RepID=UPI001D052B63|nr:uncharacterized protein KVR01_002950 [Diaporthe batatas]KAG8167261.1 hypothetical protein KVR01_002950 [Diaporthe batatas]
MSREEDSAAPGPQVVGSTTYSDSLPESNNVVLFPSDASAIEEDCRGCVAAEAESPLPWKLCVLRARSTCGNTPESSVAANAGSPRSGTDSDVPHTDASEPYDRAECLRGVDPNNGSATLEAYQQSMFDFSAEIHSNLKEMGPGQLENGVEGGIELGRCVASKATRPLSSCLLSSIETDLSCRG